MSSQRNATITRQVPEQHIEDKDNQWILEDPTITSKMGSLSASTVISIDTWQKNAKQRIKNERPEHAINVTRKDILPETTKRSK